MNRRKTETKPRKGARSKPRPGTAAAPEEDWRRRTGPSDGDLEALSKVDVEGHAAWLADPRLQNTQRQALTSHLGQLSGNRQLERMVTSLRGPAMPDALQRQEAAEAEAEEVEELDENASSPEAPGLTVGVVQEIEDLIRRRRRRAALDVLVEHLGNAGQINLDLLHGRRMYYVPGLAGEGAAPTPGFRRDPATREWVARPTSVRIGPAAFRRGISWLYSSVMHEYQHVLQFQQNVARGTMGQRSLGWLIERQEVEAYATEIINSATTGLDQHPRQMRETWRRLHSEHWRQLGRKSRRLLNDLYVRAHEIAQRVVGDRVRLSFRPAR